MWKTIPLGEVAEVKAGNSAPQDESFFHEGTVPFVRTSDVGAIRTGRLATARDLLNPTKSEKFRIFKKGTVLFPKSGASTLLNYRVALSAEAYVSSHLAGIKAHTSDVLDDYLFYFLQTVDAADLLADSSYPSLQVKVIQRIPIFVPPLAEQKRIVERLDKAFAEIDKAIATAEVKKEEVERLKAAMLNEDLEDLLSEKPHVCLSDVCPRVSVGHVGTTSKHYCDDGIPFIRTQNVSKYGFDDSGLKYITREFHEALKKSQIKAGDVLLTRVVIDEMRTAIIPENYGEANCANVILIRPSDDLDSQFLSLLIKSEKSQRYFMGVKKGAAQQVVNTGILKAWRLPLPSLTEQRGFVRRTLAKFRHIDKAMESINLSAQKSSELKVAILKQELTPSEAV